MRNETTISPDDLTKRMEEAVAAIIDQANEGVLATRDPIRWDGTCITFRQIMRDSAGELLLDEDMNPITRETRVVITDGRARGYMNNLERVLNWDEENR